MKIELANVAWQKGSSPCGETGPLFPPLHVNETGIKAGVRAPPRNKMALFEQFTVPFNRHVPSHEAALANPSPTQHGANECHFNYLSCAVPATLVSTDNVNRELGTNVKSSYGSSIGSLSTCSAIVNMDESHRVQIREPAEDASPSIGVIHKQIQRSGEKVLKDKSEDVNACNGINLPLHIVDHRQACGQPVGVILQSFHDCDDSLAGGTFNPKIVNITERSHQEATTNCEGLASAGSQLSGPENGENEHNMNTDILSPDGSNQLKSIAQFVECHPSIGSNANPLQKAGVISQDDSPCIVNVADAKAPFLSASSCEKKLTSAMVIPPCLDSINPKDVINAVGQRLFWKARKAILRQQEVFSNQVFELHRLIMVQKLLAEMPSTLIDEHMLLGGASDKLGCDHLCNEGVSNEQKNLAERRAQAPAPPQKCGGQARESKPQRKVVPCEDSEGQGDGAGFLTNASLPRVLTNAQFGQPSHSLSSNGMSAWGYPMGSWPFNYPSGSSSLPSGSPFGGAYVIGPNPPFAFPCYAQRPEQTSVVCPNNQWPSAMYPNPFLAPMVNDWFAMNYQGGRAPLASASEKARPISSAPSINMKAGASTLSVQPAVVPCARQQLGSSRLPAMRSHGSYAPASASTPLNALSRKPGAGNVGEQGRPGSGSGCVAPKGWGAYEGERKAETGRSRNVKAVQPPTISGLRVDVDTSLGGNALNLFPLQPSSSLGGGSEGRVSRQAHCQGLVIKAVPRPALAASESAAGILLSIQRERQL